MKELMSQAIKTTAALGVAALLAGCTSGNAGVEPPFTSVNTATIGKLQFAVGTVTFPGTAPVGLNTVVTFRQSSGNSAVLVSTPTITGPTGFLVPAVAAAGTDGGTNRISGSAQTTAIPGATAVATTFGTSGGAFGYGFAPVNATNLGSASFTLYTLPFFGTNPPAPAQPSLLTYRGGPPAFPGTRDGTFAAGFAGYTEGFVDFANVTLAAGTYALSVVVPTSPTANTSYSATANLASTTAVLPAFTAAGSPVLTTDGTGGGTIAITVPAGVTETLINVVNLTGGACIPSSQTARIFYTVLTRNTGPQTISLPSNLGPPIVGPGTSTPTRTLCSGDTYRVYAVGFDYPAIEAAYPFSTSQSPTITGVNGQADITLSAATGGTSL